MAAPTEADRRRTEKQPNRPPVRIAPFEPHRNADPDLQAFVIPGLFVDAWSETVKRYGQQHADRFQVRTHVLSARLRERTDDARELQADLIASKILTSLKKTGIQRIKLGGDSQGGSIAMSVYKKLVDAPGLTIEELHLRYTRGLTQENVLGLHQLFGLDTIATIAKYARHPIQNLALLPIIGQYVTDVQRERRRTRRAGVRRDLIRASGQLNHDIRSVRPPTRVILEIGENDFLSYFKHLFPGLKLYPETDEGKLAAEIKARFLPLLDQNDPTNVTVRIIRDETHIGVLFPPEPSRPRRKRRGVVNVQTSL